MIYEFTQFAAVVLPANCHKAWIACFTLKCWYKRMPRKFKLAKVSFLLRFIYPVTVDRIEASEEDDWTTCETIATFATFALCEILCNAWERCK